MEVLLMDGFIAVLVAVLTSSVPDMLEKLFGVFKAYLELKRSREERSSLTEARRTNRPKHLKE